MHKGSAHPPDLPGSCSPPHNWQGRCPACRDVPPPASSCPPPCGYRQCHPSSESAPCRPEQGPQPELRSSWILLPFRPCSANPEFPLPSGDAHCSPALRSPPECRASPRGQGRGEKGTYLGDCAWKSNLSLAAFLYAGGEDRRGDPGQAVVRTYPSPSCTLTLLLPPPYLLLFLPGRADPSFRGTKVCEEARAQLGKATLGVGDGAGIGLAPPMGTSGSRGLYDLSATPPTQPPGGTSVSGA